jgi:hypothetical protein
VVDEAPGAGGATSATGAGGATVAVPPCEPVAATVDGTVDGQPLHAAPELHSAGGGDCFTFLMDGHGFLRLTSQQGFSKPGLVVSDHGWLRLPGPDVVAGHWLCSDAPTPVTLTSPNPSVPPSKASFAWPSLHDLGACPGVPVDAALTLGSTGLSGTLDGAAVSLASLSSSSSTQDGATWEIHELGGCGMVEIDNSTSPPSGAMLMPPEGPDAGAMFCIGSITKTDAGFVLGGVSRLGTCGEAKTVGAVGVCAGF